MYSDCYCSCSFESEIIKIGLSSHKMYSNNILNFQESTTILNACTKTVWKLIEGTSFIHHPDKDKVQSFPSIFTKQLHFNTKNYIVAINCKLPS